MFVVAIVLGLMHINVYYMLLGKDNSAILRIVDATSFILFDVGIMYAIMLFAVAIMFMCSTSDKKYIRLPMLYTLKMEKINNSDIVQYGGCYIMYACIFSLMPSWFGTLSSALFSVYRCSYNFAELVVNFLFI